jgi:hypothetical protein
MFSSAAPATSRADRSSEADGSGFAPPREADDSEGSDGLDGAPEGSRHAARSVMTRTRAARSMPGKLAGRSWDVSGGHPTIGAPSSAHVTERSNLLVRERSPHSVLSARSSPRASPLPVIRSGSPTDKSRCQEARGSDQQEDKHARKTPPRLDIGRITRGAWWCAGRDGSDPAWSDQGSRRWGPPPDRRSPIHFKRRLAITWRP